MIFTVALAFLFCSFLSSSVIAYTPRPTAPPPAQTRGPYGPGRITPALSVPSGQLINLLSGFNPLIYARNASETSKRACGVCNNRANICCDIDGTFCCDPSYSANCCARAGFCELSFWCLIELDRCLFMIVPWQVFRRGVVRIGRCVYRSH